MSVEWGYFNNFKWTEKYLPASGEGDTKATQIVTAVTKLIYKYYNDGDVFDNSYALEGWANNLSSFANWLDHYTDRAYDVLRRIESCVSEDDYEDLLKDLVDVLFNKEYLRQQNELPKVGSIYDCDGQFRFVIHSDYEDEAWY